MTESPSKPRSLAVRDDHPLIGVRVEENGQALTRYFSDEAAADAVLTENGTQAALAAIGAWADLDWPDAMREFDRIRHESEPTPPIAEL
ncbi:MAG TPA: hypothetical protein VFU81_00600 [Thermomicrobiales bacterium]|nr:hypothetical protein [Thermomicrobiales bacterium]